MVTLEALSVVVLAEGVENVVELVNSTVAVWFTSLGRMVAVDSALSVEVTSVLAVEFNSVVVPSVGTVLVADVVEGIMVVFEVLAVCRVVVSGTEVVWLAVWLLEALLLGIALVAAAVLVLLTESVVESLVVSSVLILLLGIVDIVVTLLLPSDVVDLVICD